MPFIRSVLNRYKDHIVYTSISESYLASYSTVMTESKEDLFFRQDPGDLTIFICSLPYYQNHEAQFARFERLTLVIADKAVPGDPGFYSHRHYMNLLQISASVLEVYAQFLACFHMYHIWRTHLNTTFTYANPSTIMPALSHVAGAAVYMYSQSDLILMDYSCSGFDTPFTRQLCACFYLTEEIRPSVKQIRNPPENPVCGTLSGGLSYMLHSLRDFQGFSIILLFVYKERLSIEIPPNDFLYMISGQWEKHMDFQKNFHHYIVPTSCDQLISLLSSPESPDSAIQEQIRELAYPLKRWNAFINIHFPQLDSPALHQVILKNELQDIFPEINLAFYQDAITIVYSTNLFSIHPLLPENFTEWLKNHNACAAVGPLSDRQKPWKEHLSLCRRLFDIGYAADSHPVLYYEDYLIQLILDRFQLTTSQHTIPGCFCHPAIRQICDYDRENHTCFFQVLFQYLYQSCNINQASAALFMHRNTVRKQIRRIEELFQLDLTRPDVRMQLLFSFFLSQKQNAPKIL